MKKDILIMFGGVSAEHEVSIITGLQVFEKIDLAFFTPHAIYVERDGTFSYLPSLTSRADFASTKRTPITWRRDHTGPQVHTTGLIKQTIKPAAAYLAFHGGTGEGGPIQGFMETLGIPYTGPSPESAVITMNKQVTKSVLGDAGVDVVPGAAYLSPDIRANSLSITEACIKLLKLPAIVKPAHLGSSIGIKVAHTDLELEKALIEASYMDTEVLVESYLPKFDEYNCAVRSLNGVLETSEIEHPLSSSEILSFADKYENGGKKSGGSGMASLQRELPAKIDDDLKARIQEVAKISFLATRSRGMARIDFMYVKTGKRLYLTEINPIPGSMAFYLWEASGISFTQQITDMIEQSIRDHQETKTLQLDYKTDIVEKFVSR